MNPHYKFISINKRGLFMENVLEKGDELLEPARDIIIGTAEELRSLLFRFESIRLTLGGLPSGMIAVREKLDEDLKTCLADVYSTLEYCSNLVNDDSDLPEH